MRVMISLCGRSADLHLRYLHRHKAGFLLTRLNYLLNYKKACFKGWSREVNLWRNCESTIIFRGIFISKEINSLYSVCDR